MKKLFLSIFIFTSAVLFGTDLYYISGSDVYKVLVISTNTKTIEYSEYNGDQLIFSTDSVYRWLSDRTYQTKINGKLSTFYISMDMSECILKYNNSDIVMKRIAYE
jgi:hypothetical protein